MRSRILGCALLLAFLTAPALASDPFLRRTTTVRVVENVGPTVVNITTERLVRRSNPFRPYGADPVFERFFRDFFEPRVPETSKSLGSGVVIDAAGHILTNEHVIDRADRIRVSLADGREFDARLIGADTNNDIAVLEVETDEELPWIPLSSSEDLMVGEPVIAIGNPFGLSNTVTTGVISALDRSVRTESHVYHGFLQTDASINPGNSGGPLLNAEGKLIGVNTAVYGGGQGIGFAIPIDVARRVVAELIEHGEVTPVWIGLEFQDLNPDLGATLGIPSDVSGALVNRIREKSPASRAGLQRGDVVTHVDGHEVGSARGFFEILMTVTARQVLAVRFWRNGDFHTTNVLAEQFPDDLLEQLTDQLLGLDLRKRREGGFLVMGVRGGGGAERTGIRVGDLILAVNGRTLVNEDTLRRSLLELRGRSRAMVVVQRGPGRYNVTVPLT
jgi:serine protease Do